MKKIWAWQDKGGRQSKERWYKGGEVGVNGHLKEKRQNKVRQVERNEWRKQKMKQGKAGRKETPHILTLYHI